MLQLDGSALTCDQVVAVARGGSLVRYTGEALARIDTAARQAAAVAARSPVYGRGTGVGANRTVAIAADDGGHGLRVLRSHAAAAGRPLPAAAVRAMLLVRANQLAQGGSGVAAATAQALVRMLNDDALPTVRSHGSVGTGDLTGLAATALTLIGERPATRPWQPLTAFDGADALAFISSNALTLGRAALAAWDLERLIRAGAVTAGLSFAAVDGNTEAFSEAARRTAPSDGVATVGDWLRGLTAAAPAAARVQDPFGYRAYPQVHGVLVDAWRDLAGSVETLTATAQENPLIVTAARDDDAAAVHHGGFHLAGLALKLDTVRLALAQTTPLLLGRLRTLNDPAYTRLPAFLAAGPAGASGTMILEYVAASAHGALRAAAAPVGLETAVLSHGTEEDASFASLGARQLEDAVAAFRPMLACELLTAARALLMRAPGAPRSAGGPLDEALRRWEERTGPRPDAFDDRDLQDELLAAEEIVGDLADLLPRPTYYGERRYSSDEIAAQGDQLGLITA
ncbi:histidine ammonia-lyase [Murinocardiopsis flavida]|uniref:Histidine ammonia-lyase n=1 Tax=Murinocardiopsis flavida TaxID=645275 RepID=A0A2P8DIQ0_9ACTN|nr:histidine ammonia-lyase [Murinocardiopsis flavida]